MMRKYVRPIFSQPLSLTRMRVKVVAAPPWVVLTVEWERKCGAEGGLPHFFQKWHPFDAYLRFTLLSSTRGPTFRVLYSRR